MAWELKGNAGTDPATTFLGTTDGQPLVIQPGGGNIGIGTTKPDTRLNINSNSPDAQAVLTISDGNADTRVGLWSGFSAGGNSPAVIYTHDLRFGLGQDFSNGEDFSEAIRITSDGNIGIGTQTPSSKVEIAAQDGLAITGFQPFITLRDANAGNARSFMQGVNGDIVLIPDSFSASQSAAMVIKTNTGNVGIGTSEPSSKVEIVAQDGLAITGFQPFITLRDANAGNARSFMQGVNGDIVLIPDSFSASQSAAMVIKTNTGNVGIGTASPEARLHVVGDVQVKGDIRLANADCAEDFDIANADLAEPGTVMVLSDDGTLEPSQISYDKRVAGVISGARDYKPGIVLDKRGSQPNRKPVALLGKVYCKVDAKYGAVEMGDLLTTSPTLGYAMKATDQLKAFGAVIGKAMRPLASGQDLIPILIALQ